MTDAERIAEYLNAQECGNPWTANDVDQRIADPSTQCHDLARMLSDVRREEREACLAAIDAEIAIGLQLNAPSPVGYLRDARFRITERGTK